MKLPPIAWVSTPVLAGFASVTWNIVDALQLATRTMSPVASVLVGELAATCGAATVVGIAATIPRPGMSAGTRTVSTSLVGSGAEALGSAASGPVSAGEKLVPSPCAPLMPDEPDRKPPSPARSTMIGASLSSGRQPTKDALRISVCSTSIARRAFSLIRVVDAPTACSVRVLTKIETATRTTNRPTAMPTISSTSVMPRAAGRSRRSGPIALMAGR